MMKFSAADWAYYSKASDKDSYYQKLKEIGYDGVEMVDPSRWEKARAAGLEILNISGPGMEKGLNRVENHSELIPKIREAISLAGSNRIPYVIVFSGNRAGQPDAEGIENCRIALEQVVGDAGKNKVTLLFEMLNSYEHKDYQADHGKYGFTLAKKINSPFLKLLYDIYHMERMGDNSSADVTANLSMIPHLHLAESPKRDIPKSRGQIRYEKIVPRIVKAGYQGYWGMEFLPSGDVMKELDEARKLFVGLGAL